MTNKKKRLRLLIPIILIGIFVFRFLKQGPMFSVETYYPTKTEFVSQIDTMAYMIFDEEVYTASGDGVVEYEVTEGTRVPKDEIIATLSLTEDVTALKEELLNVQSAIEYKNQSLNPNDDKYEISDREINLMTSIQEAIDQNDRAKTLMAIETLELNTRKNIDISQIGDLINLSNQQLEDMREELSKEISTNNVVYRAARSGVLTLQVDGLEDQLSIDSMDSLTVENIKSYSDYVSDEVTSSVKKGSYLYKIIDNYEYYMAMVVESDRFIQNLEEGDNLEIVVDGSILVPTEVSKIDIGEEESLLIVRSKESLMDLGYKRAHNVSIIKNVRDTYIIKTKSIIEQDGILGVYVKELNGIVKFVPVSIMMQQENDTLVDVGDESGVILLDNGETSSTITIYDQVIEEPGSVQEGQIV